MGKLPITWKLKSFLDKECAKAWFHFSKNMMKQGDYSETVDAAEASRL